MTCPIVGHVTFSCPDGLKGPEAQKGLEMLFGIFKPAQKELSELEKYERAWKAKQENRLRLLNEMPWLWTINPVGKWSTWEIKVIQVENDEQFLDNILARTPAANEDERLGRCTVYQHSNMMVRSINVSDTMESELTMYDVLQILHQIGEAEYEQWFRNRIPGTGGKYRARPGEDMIMETTRLASCRGKTIIVYRPKHESTFLDLYKKGREKRLL